MHFETQQSLIKNDCYLFMKIIVIEMIPILPKNINRHLIWGGSYNAVLGIPHT